MSHAMMRELAKIGTGIVIGDIILTLWLSGSSLLPMSLLGVRWTSEMVPEILVFDIALLIFLVHFGWHMKLPIQSPSERVLLLAAGAIFLAMGLGHLVQLGFGTHLWLGDFMVPHWVSWIGIATAGYLAYACFHFTRHLGRR